MGRTHHIYSIREVGTEGPVYVGRTNDLINRLRLHATVKRPTNIGLLMQDPDREFEVTILETIGPDDVWKGREEAWRQMFIREGFDLLNMVKCGETGFEDESLSQEQRLNFSRGQRGKKPSTLERTKRSLTMSRKDRSGWKQTRDRKTDDQVISLRRDINEMWTSGQYTQGQIGKRLGVTQTYVARVVGGKGPSTLSEKRERRAT